MNETVSSSRYLELNPWQKRQATLLYHYSSLAYVEGLLNRIDLLVSFAESLLEERSNLDPAGRMLANWQPIDTAGHFSTYACPALMEFREGVIKDIAARAHQVFDIAGERQCSRMLDEYAYQMPWATQDQEEQFKHRAQAVFHYASKISEMMSRPSLWDDFVFWSLWQEDGKGFSHIPRFRVRSDLCCFSGDTPPRTGAYVPADDPYGSLQFGWTGGHGELGNTYTLNQFGKLALERVGREGLWEDVDGLHRLISGPEGLLLRNIQQRERSRPHLAPAAASRESFEDRPCRWFFVELIDDEYEEIDGTYAGTSSVATATRPHRVEAGRQVPQNGWWYTPAQMGSRRYFKKDDRFPELKGSDYGNVLWIWSPDQSDPKL
ncbi:hypothetical protein ACPEH1_08945 [Stenotrophomonas sp. NPDC077421]|uniref:hypothetical protein n=1 Tax=Stenotrophomonas sp. NPDC077421 TaxID=3414699 RepID=UPI003C2C9C43